ncbi:hypothetical protein EFY87_19665 [Flexivirga caeni]|uniref:DUF5615 domain-containing protein n=1 Tax=Flexivirga caeni TaxID=2294115 RepID=A0A3M9LXF8_9MICO|nr:hypothetical protein EFY87_19665 [Flexivirga caeni]
MRLLLDNNLSPRLREFLEGYDVEHVRNLGMAAAPDDEVIARAEQDRRVLVSADTDFGQLLAVSGARLPSVVLLRRQSGRRVEQIADLLQRNLPQVAEDLSDGAVVVLTNDEIRVRHLPISSV